MDYFCEYRDIEISFPAFESALIYFRHAEINIKVAEITEFDEIAEIIRKVPFQNKELNHSTK